MMRYDPKAPGDMQRNERLKRIGELKDQGKIFNEDGSWNIDERKASGEARRAQNELMVKLLGDTKELADLLRDKVENLDALDRACKIADKYGRNHYMNCDALDLLFAEDGGADAVIQSIKDLLGLEQDKGSMEWLASAYPDAEIRIDEERGEAIIYLGVPYNRAMRVLKPRLPGTKEKKA